MEKRRLLKVIHKMNLGNFIVLFIFALHVIFSFTVLIYLVKIIRSNRRDRRDRRDRRLGEIIQMNHEIIARLRNNQIIARDHERIANLRTNIITNYRNSLRYVNFETDYLNSNIPNKKNWKKEGF